MLTLSNYCQGPLDRPLYPELWDGLSAFYSPSLGFTGDELVDFSGNGYHLAKEGSWNPWTTSEQGTVLDMDGETTTSNAFRLVIPTGIVTQPLSLYALCRIDDAADVAISLGSDSVSNTYYRLGAANVGGNYHIGRARSPSANGTADASSSGVTIGTWQSTLFTTDGSNQILYTEGVYRDTDTTTVAPDAADIDEIVVGNREQFQVSALSGLLGPAGWWSRILSEKHAAILKAHPSAPLMRRPAPTVIFNAGYTPPSEPDARPNYHGRPTIPGLVSITPKITVNRTSGYGPFALHVSAEQTTYNDGTEQSGSLPFQNLDYRWDFGHTGEYAMTDWHARYRSVQVDPGDEQQGPRASYVYPEGAEGSYTVTLTASGRTATGQLVSATTTTVLKLGEWEPFLASATGGTYTITVDGQTTSAIAYDADSATLVAAIEALSTVGAGNVRACEYGYGDDTHTYLTFEFTGSLAGQTLTVTGNFASLTGTSGTAQLVERQVAETASQVTVNDLPAGTYFDSEWGGTESGTEAEPYSSAATLETFLEASDEASRVVYLKRGSTFDFTSRIVEQHDGTQQVFVLDYGTGDKPEIQCNPDDNTFRLPTYTNTPSIPDVSRFGYVFRNIKFTRDSGGGSSSVFWCYEAFGVNTDYPHQQYDGLAWIDCDYEVLNPSHASITGATQANPVVITAPNHGFTNGMEVYISGVAGMTELNSSSEYTIANVTTNTFELSGVNGTGYGAYTSGGTVKGIRGSFIRVDMIDSCQGMLNWNTTADFATDTALAALQPNLSKFQACVGGYLQRLYGLAALDHFVYPNVIRDSLYRYMRMSDGDGGSCINNNCKGDRRSRFYLVDGNRLDGMPIGMDLASNINNAYGATDGFLDGGVAQFNWIQPNQNATTITNWIGIIGYNYEGRAIRYNDFVRCDQVAIHVNDTTKTRPDEVYFNNSYGDNALYQGRRDSVYLQYNKIHRLKGGDGSTSSAINFYTDDMQTSPASAALATWDVDNNTIYNDGDVTIHIGYDNDTATSYDWTAWQGTLGFDANGSNADPAFESPEDGYLYELDELPVTDPTNIDTRAKRAAVVGIARPWMRTHEPAANSAEWRSSVGLTYYGLAQSELSLNAARLDGANDPALEVARGTATLNPHSGQAQGLAAWYPMTESWAGSFGTSLNTSHQDLTGCNAPTQLLGVPRFAAYRHPLYGGVRLVDSYFDNSNILYAPGPNEKLDALRNWTVCAWVHPEQYGRQGMVLKRTSTRAYHGIGFYMWDSSDGSIYARVHDWIVEPDRGEVDVSEDPTLNYLTVNSGEWTHIAVSYDNDTGVVQFFINGILRRLGNCPPGRMDAAIADGSNTDLRIGTLYSEGFEGSICDLRFYNRVLPARSVHDVASNGQELAQPRVQRRRTAFLPSYVPVTPKPPFSYTPPVDLEPAQIKTWRVRRV